MGTTPTASAATRQPGRVQSDTASGAGPSLPQCLTAIAPIWKMPCRTPVPPLESHAVNTLLRYHLGWSDRHGVPSPSPASQGKALRPTLCMFACEACHGEPRQAAQAAAALELIHNFSLLHDDIQDQGAERRHQPTVWGRLGDQAGAGSRRRYASHRRYDRAAYRGRRSRRYRHPGFRVIDPGLSGDD